MRDEKSIKGSEVEAKMKLKSGKRGFSLVEVLLALMILSVGLLAVAQLQVTAIRSLAYSRHLSTATQLGEQQLEYLRSLPYDPTNASIYPNKLNPDSSTSQIKSKYNGTDSPPLFGVINTVSDWHSHINNPVNALGDRGSGGQGQYFIRWRIERGPPVSASAFSLPGIKQIRIQLQVIWWESGKKRPAGWTWAANTQCTEIDLKAWRAHWINLETIRQVDM
jgi:prepilin-type N-terminal cleavage/methylation domain-containing protein